MPDPIHAFVIDVIDALAMPGISTSLLANMDLFSQYSAAAYCNAVTTGSVGTTITCTTNNCPLVEAGGATVLGSFNKYDRHEFCFYESIQLITFETLA